MLHLTVPEALNLAQAHLLPADLDSENIQQEVSAQTSELGGHMETPSLTLLTFEERKRIWPRCLWVPPELQLAYFRSGSQASR
ncbi:Heat Shock Transcription Factor, Y-Linked [Manis pentadactyla]|nr:Heat Shock Transcription Factor, Y-Linked [Manis pentadactyla]